MGQYLYQLPDSDNWVYPSIKTTSNVAGMHTMEDYLKTRWAYIENYATSTPILQSCMDALKWSKQDLFNNIVEDNAWMTISK
jgi:hypothetical protein